MKRYTSLISAFIMCLSLILLSSCSPSSKLTGTWQGDGSLDMLGMEAPYEFATQLIFNSESTLIVKVGDEEAEFKYSATDDTLTINGDEMSWGVRYKVSGKTLSIETGNGSAIFTKE